MAGTTNLYYYSDRRDVLCDYNDAGALRAYYVYGNYVYEVPLQPSLSRGGEFRS